MIESLYITLIMGVLECLVSWSRGSLHCLIFAHFISLVIYHVDFYFRNSNKALFRFRDAKYPIPLREGFHWCFKKEACLWNLQRDGEWFFSMFGIFLIGYELVRNSWIHHVFFRSYMLKHVKAGVYLKACCLKIWTYMWQRHQAQMRAVGEHIVREWILRLLQST